MTNQIEELTTEQLEELLAERKKNERLEAHKKKEQYERSRNFMIHQQVAAAIQLRDELKAFKDQAFGTMHKFYADMMAYGDVKRDGKGNFQLISDDQQYKIIFANQIKAGFDERAEMAEVKLKEFLNTTVKKRDLGLHGIIMGLLERNKVSGDFDIKLINRLVKMEDKFDDANWKEAIRLFKESYQEQGTSSYIRFYERNNDQQSWQLINLNLASV